MAELAPTETPIVTSQTENDAAIIRAVQEFTAGSGNAVMRVTPAGAWFGHRNQSQALTRINFDDGSIEIGSYGEIKIAGSNMVIGTPTGGGSFFLEVGGTNELEVSASAIMPNADGGLSLGTSSKKFYELNCGGISCTGIAVSGNSGLTGSYLGGTFTGGILTSA